MSALFENERLSDVFRESEARPNRASYVYVEESLDTKWCHVFWHSQQLGWRKGWMTSSERKKWNDNPDDLWGVVVVRAEDGNELPRRWEWMEKRLSEWIENLGYEEEYREAYRGVFRHLEGGQIPGPVDLEKMPGVALDFLDHILDLKEPKGNAAVKEQLRREEMEAVTTAKVAVASEPHTITTCKVCGGSLERSKDGGWFCCACAKGREPCHNGCSKGYSRLRQGEDEWEICCWCKGTGYEPPGGDEVVPRDPFGAPVDTRGY